MKPATHPSRSQPSATAPARDPARPSAVWEAMEQRSPVGLYQTDARGSCIYVNERWCELAGLPAEHALGNGWTRALHPDDRERIAAAWSRAAAAASPFASEYRFRHPDGTVAWVFGQATPEIDDDGQVVAFVGSVTDISERRLAEDALRTSEARFRALADATATAFWTVDELGDPRAADTTRWPYLTDLPPEETTAGWLAAVHPDDREPGNAAWQAGLAEGRPFSFEQRVRQRDGSWRHFLVRAVPVRGADGAIREWVGADIDITRRKRTEAELRERDELLRLTLQAARAGAWAVDLATDQDEWSPEVFPLLGRQPGEIDPAFANLLAIVHPDDRDWLREKATTDIAAGREGQSEFRVVWPDGSVHWILARGRTIIDAAGAPRRVGLFLDITERKQAEEAVRESEERFRSLVSIITDVPWTADADGAFAAMQPAWAAFTGQTWDEMRGFGWVDALHPDDRDTAGQNRERALTEQTTYESRGRLWHAPTRQYRHYVARATPLLNADGSIREWVGACTDVHERTLAEEALHQSQAHLAALINQSISGIAETDLNGRFTLVNDRYCEITGYARDELIDSMRMQQITHPDDLPRNIALFQRLAKDGAPFTIEKRYIRKDGSIIWVNNSVSAIRDDAGRPRSAVAVSVDVTERKRAEIARRENEERLRLGMDIAGFALLEVNYETDVIHLSAEAALLYGLGDSAVTLPREQVHAAFHPDDRDELTRRIALGPGPDAAEPYTAEYRVLWPSGEVRWLSVRKQVVFDRDGPTPRPVRSMLAALDITARKQAEADRQALLDALAHDLRNPLTALKIQAQLLLRQVERGRTFDRDTLTARMAGFVELARHMTGLIDDLEEHARLAGGGAPDRQATDLVALARVSVDEFRQSGGTHTIRLETDERELIGFWDPLHVRRVLENLLGNAVKYSPVGSVVQVRLSRAGRYAVLEIRDEGIGIPADDLPHVFTFRHRGGNVGLVAGSGVGLAGVKQIVERHGGSVTVQSEEGQGSVFTVRLPLLAFRR